MQAAVTGEGPYANWSKHVSDPFGYNLLTILVRPPLLHLAAWGAQDPLAYSAESLKALYACYVTLQCIASIVDAGSGYHLTAVRERAEIQLSCPSSSTSRRRHCSLPRSGTSESWQ